MATCMSSTSLRVLFKSYIYEHFDEEIVSLRIKQEAFGQ
jgi:hypothetical protein